MNREKLFYTSVADLAAAEKIRRQRWPMGDPPWQGESPRNRPWLTVLAWSIAFALAVVIGRFTA